MSQIMKILPVILNFLWSGIKLIVSHVIYIVYKGSVWNSAGGNVLHISKREYM